MDGDEERVVNVKITIYFFPTYCCNIYMSCKWKKVGYPQKLR